MDVLRARRVRLETDGVRAVTGSVVLDVGHVRSLYRSDSVEDHVGVSSVFSPPVPMVNQTVAKRLKTVVILYSSIKTDNQMLINRNAMKM